MAQKPDFLKWVGNDDVTRIADPGATKKANGWLDRERPPFQFVNYLFNIAFKWYRGLQTQYAQVVVGSSSQKTALDATHVVDDLNDALVTAGTRVVFLEGTHAPTASLNLTAANITIECENGAAVIDLQGSKKLTFSGAGARVAVNVTNIDTTVTDNVTVSGAGAYAVVTGCNPANMTVGVGVRFVAPNSVWSTGDVKVTLKPAADPGWVMMNDGNIGDASSGATTRANADTLELFKLLWNNTTNTNCPVSTGRGLTAVADFAAHKTIALPKAVGRALAVAGAGAGLSARALAVALGEEAHQLTTGEMPIHNHGVNDFGHNHGISDPGHAHTQTGWDSGGSGPGSQARGQFNTGLVDSFSTEPNTTGIVVLGNTSGITLNNTGGGGTHNNMQPTSFFNIMVKL